MIFHSALPKPRVSAFKFFSFGLRRYAALSTCPCLALRLHTCSLSVLVTYEQGGGMRIAMALRLSVVSLLFTHAFRSYILQGIMML